MAVGTGAMLAFSIASAAVGAYGAMRQAQAQKQQAAYQSEVAGYNAQVADNNALLEEQRASADRRQGYEDKLAARQQAARIIGQQRAMAGASGAAVDTGGTLDWTLDTAERGEIDAQNAFQRGLDAAYDHQLNAWNARSQASQARAQAAAYKDQGDNINPWLAGGTSLLGSAASIGLGFGRDLWGTNTAKIAGKTNALINAGVAKLR